MKKHSYVILSSLFLSLGLILSGCAKEEPKEEVTISSDLKDKVRDDLSGKNDPVPNTETQTTTETTTTVTETVPGIDPAPSYEINNGSDTGIDTSAADAAAGKLDKKTVVGMVTDEGGIEDQSFNQSAWEGLQWFSGSSGCNAIFLESKTNDDMEKNFEKLAKDGTTLIWGIGNTSGKPVSTVAAKYPDIKFAILDNENASLGSNVTGVTFRSEEPGFIVGYIAGAVTKSNKVGFIGGVQSASVDRFRYGYEAGVAYAGKQLNKKITVTSEYAGSFSDTDKGYAVADKLYIDGVDVIFHAAGGAGVGVIKSATEHGAFVIGVDKDQAYLAPGNVLTSALKFENIAIKKVSGDILSESYIGGSNISLGLTEDAVGFSENHSLYSDDIYNKALSLENEIKSGTLLPPSDANALKTFTEGL